MKQEGLPKWMFDIKNFAKEFKNTIRWMLGNTYARDLKNDLQYLKITKTNLAETLIH